MWKLLKYEFRRARTSLLTVLGVIAVLEMYFLISLGVDHMEHVVIAAVLMMFATYGAAVYVFVRGVASYASELKAKSAYLIFMTPNSGLKIMGSKYLYTFVNGILLGGVCGALGALDLSLIMMHEDDWQSFLRMMDIFLRVNQGVQTGQIVLAIVFYLVLVLLSLLTFFAMAYFAITLSHTLFRDKGCAADFHRRVLGAELFAGAAAEPGGEPRVHHGERPERGNHDYDVCGHDSADAAVCPVRLGDCAAESVRVRLDAGQKGIPLIDRKGFCACVI